MASASSAHAALGGVRADARLVRRHSKPRRAATAGPPIVASASRRGAGSRAPGGSERARLATSSPSRGGPAPTARDPPRRGGRLVPRAARRDRVPVGDMKRALANAGVDTSACFERADLEAKFALLTDAEKANVAEASAEATAGTAGSANANAKTSSSASSASGGGSSSSSSSKSSSSGASSDDDRKKKTSQKFTPRAIIDNILSAVRESANRADVRWGVGEKFREQTKGFVESAKRLDETIGVSRLAKNTLPPLWRTIQEFRRTPLGRVADVVFYVWLFLSGAFWTILTVGIAGAFVTNLLFPNFFRDRAAKAQEEAQRRFAEAQRAQGGMGGGYPGGAGGGYPGGAGGMGGGYPGGMGGMGGPGGGMGGQPGAGGRGAGAGGGGRKTYGGGGDGGAVVDVDADVKDV